MGEAGKDMPPIGSCLIMLSRSSDDPLLHSDKVLILFEYTRRLYVRAGYYLSSHILYMPTSSDVVGEDEEQ